MFHLSIFEVLNFDFMKAQIFSFSAAALVAVSLSSCSKDEDQDTVPPQIKSAQINGSEEDVAAPAGSYLVVEADLSDNEALGQLKIDIHDVFDGHGHEKKSFVRWADVKNIDLTGTEASVADSLLVPSGVAAGPYHAVLRLIDEAGNEADFVEREFMITNASQPEIELTSPDFTNEVHLNPGTVLSLAGTVSDDVDLQEIFILLEEDHEEGADHKSTLEEPLYEQDFDLPGTADLSWDFQADGQVDIPVPATAEPGHYVLQIVARDSEGNMNIFEAEVHVE